MKKTVPGSGDGLFVCPWEDSTVYADETAAPPGGGTGGARDAAVPVLAASSHISWRIWEGASRKKRKRSAVFGPMVCPRYIYPTTGYISSVSRYFGRFKTLLSPENVVTLYKEWMKNAPLFYKSSKFRDFEGKEVRATVPTISTNTLGGKL